ncbi:MAG TPA: class I SAM-dependent methyltransferase [Pyrinomonadaceae bacterium]|jgi:ubiquinone/menaquinone biosynthesis C-methylase UbiE
MASEYDSYVRAEWEMFVADEGRSRASLEAVAGLDARRVLDVGCGAGQELLPFASRAGAVCVGADVTPEAGLAGRELFASRAPAASVAFVRAAAESLPFPDGAFDVVICRLALPYTDNARCLSELARVLRPGGALLLKIHHARFYVRDLGAAARRGDARAAAYNARVLLAGLVYLLTGRQPRTRLPSRETFQTVPLLRRELARRGLEIRRELRDSNPRTPSFLIVKS